MNKKIFISILIIILVSLSELTHAQVYDFEPYPEMDLDFNHLNLDLMVHEDGMIEGEALYDVSFRISLVDTVRLDASRMDIQRVFWGENAADFFVQNDRLLIVSPENYSRGEKLELKIGYKILPGFGIHSGTENVMWTSLLPKSISHWVPVRDHPRVTFTTRITLNYPSGLSAIATGRTTGSEVVSVDRERSVFITESPVPASALAFAIGNFEKFQTSAGLHQINLYYPEKDMLNDVDERDELLEVAYSAFRSAEQKAGFGYPWRTVHIVILDDSRWEVKNYGAGVVFAFRNKGELKDQIQYGVTAQWVGVQIREEQWSDSDFVKLLQGWFMEYKLNETCPDSNPGSVYSVFSPAVQDQRREFLNSESQELLREVIEITVPRLFRENRGVLNRQEFTQELYYESGRRFFETPFIPADVDSPKIADEDENVVYLADYNWNEDEGIVDIHISSEDEGVQELVTAILTTRYFDDSQNREISFSGASETIRMNVNPTLEYMKLMLSDESNVIIKEEKPFIFWINQLRSDPDMDSRKAAAEQLRKFSDNPDLQLAMLDRLRAEENVQVQAEIIRTLAHVTAGASGTDQIFLQRYSENREPEIKRALIEALGNYPGNEEVMDRLQQSILRSSEPDIQNKAVRSLAKVADADRFERITEQLITREESMPVVSNLLQELALKGKEQQAVAMAGTFLGELNSWQVRKSAFDLILTFETSESFWEERLPVLLKDDDPRVRYKAVEGLQFLSEQNRQKLIEESLFEEYDGRVAERLEMSNEY